MCACFRFYSGTRSLLSPNKFHWDFPLKLFSFYFCNFSGVDRLRFVQNPQSVFRSFSDSSPNYTEVKPVFDRIKNVTTPSIVKKINAVFLFDIMGEGKWFVDLKSGKGVVGEGDPDVKADVTVTLDKDIFLKIFNREVKPATAFMNGQMKLSGDLSKAMALESMMKATRNA